MKVKTVLFAAILAAAPSFALAMGGCKSGAHDETAMSCAEGHVIDAETGVCVPVVTG